jgi:hypothetical protein
MAVSVAAMMPVYLVMSAMLSVVPVLCGLLLFGFTSEVPTKAVASSQ